MNPFMSTAIGSNPSEKSEEPGTDHYFRETKSENVVCPRFPGFDIDVLVVADDLTLEEVYAALRSAETRLGRQFSPTLYLEGIRAPTRHEQSVSHNVVAD
jgi:hypothetical protein